MRIGIIKPWFEVKFRTKALSNNKWDEEVKQLFYTLIRLKHDVNFISKSDKYYNNSRDTRYDIIFVFCGRNKLKATDSSEKIEKFEYNVSKHHRFIAAYKNMWNTRAKIIYIITDLALIDKQFVAAADLIISDSPLIGHYCGFAQHVLNIKEKKIKCKKLNKMIYLGNERDSNRTKKLIRYMKQFGKNLDIYGHWKDARITMYSNYKGAIPAWKSQQLLSKYKFSLIIGDKDNEKFGLVTPRYYEAIKADCIPICDNKFDIYHKVIKVVIDKTDDMQTYINKYHFFGQIHARHTKKCFDDNIKKILKMVKCC